MSSSSGSESPRLWHCPGCGRGYQLSDEIAMPELCPRCHASRAAAEEAALAAAREAEAREAHVLADTADASAATTVATPRRPLWKQVPRDNLALTLLIALTVFSAIVGGLLLMKAEPPRNEPSATGALRVAK